MSGVRFALLGTLTVADGAGHLMTVPGARQRALLAGLLLSANAPVSSGALAEAVWDGSPPPGAATTLRSHIRRLRQALGPQVGARITACDPGYLITAAEAEFDVLRFETACRAASAARHAAQWAQASAAAARALELWRGPPLLDVPSQVLRDQFLPRLGQMRLQAVEDRAEADLRLGHHDRLIPELRDLAAEHPMRERFHAQLIEALARAGRQAEALDAYRLARQALVDELGIEPGPHLRRLHQQILDGDPALAGPPAASDADAGAGPPAPLTDPVSSPVEVPRQLPGAVPQFTGRSAELTRLSQALDQAGDQAPGTVVISAIGGTAGVGKTALAVHWAHQVADRFPDGQLYVNMRGYNPDQLFPAADALAGFLRALGVSGSDIPPDADDRAARYRSLVAGRRMLVTLDNVRSAEQARPLLPGTPTCVTVVTSRDSLAGLVAREGAVRLDLDLLPAGEAVSLLRALIGERATADPAATNELAAQCSRLPLALRVAAELAAAHPAVPLAGLVSELADQRRRLDLLDAAGDSRTAVRSVFSWSYRNLAPAAARMFRVLGLHPGPDLDSYAAAALTGATVWQAERALDALTRAHLTQLTGPGRYGLHDLLRAYARELVSASDTEDEQQAALTRLFDHYQHAAATAMDTRFPGERHRRPHGPAPATPAPPMPGPAAALAWLDAERLTLVAAVEHAADHGWPGHAIRLAATLFRYLEMTGRYPEILTVYTCSLRAARQTGDQAGEAEALNNLTVIDLRQGRYQHAADLLRQSLALLEETGDDLGRARVLGNLGIVRFQQGRYQQAAHYQEQALECYRNIGDQAGEPRTLNNLGIIFLRQGRYQQACDGFRHALTLQPDPDTRSYCLANLGVALLKLARYTEAVANLSQALARGREAGNVACEAYCLVHLGLADLRQGRCQQAADQLWQAVALSRKEGDQSAEAGALNGAGEVSLAMGRPGHARTQHGKALSLASQIGDRYEQARAHDGLGQACQARGVPAEARRHWQEALASYADMGVPEADQVRARLAGAAVRG